MAVEAVEVSLPAGLAVEGYWHRTATLRPLSGREETFLSEEGRALTVAARTTALLARCLERLGPVTRVTADSVRGLAVGDREALLLHLRRLTVGERVACLLFCPNPACGQKLDLNLPVSDLLLPPYPFAQTWHETMIRDDGARYAVRFRLPTGADQEAAATLALTDPEAAATLVLERCVERVTLEGEHDRGVDGLPPAVCRALPQLMADLDPQAEIVLKLSCPACGVAFSSLFDTADYFFRELAGRPGDFYQEVHILALHYHWSETEILAMTRRRRRLYLDLLAEAVGGERGR